MDTIDRFATNPGALNIRAGIMPKAPSTVVNGESGGRCRVRSEEHTQDCPQDGEPVRANALCFFPDAYISESPSGRVHGEP
jgi:hypothetical protein